MNLRTRYLVTTLALIAVAVAWNVVDRPASPRRAARAVAAVPASRPTPAPKTAAELLAKREALALTVEQRARLGTLAERWAREANAREADLAAASEGFGRFMAETQQKGRARLDEIQGRSVEVQELTAAFRERRARHSEEAIGVLTERQRARLAADNAIPGGAR
jgi:hypothetical protein